MEQPSQPQVRVQSKPSKMNYACEACRSSKIKCQPGSQPGICKRCFEFKRECIFRSGPRTRRPKASRPDAEALPPPPGPSQTFSIDFTMPADEDLRDNFDDLRAKHERFIENLMPSSEEDEFENDPVVTSPSAGRTFDFNDLSVPTPEFATKSRPMGNLGIKPRFNLDSAEKLLESFRSMLPHCPCIVLPDDADVRSMARDMPFVLLALLAVTSCSTSLQGHSLYDEEFRKILALKFVAGGERSLESLQGLLIYCSWYPFHLRPKNRQLMQYLRMAVDMVQDLKLDEEASLDLAALPPERRAIRLQSIRAYLICFYNTSIYSWAWSKPNSLKYTPWMAKCCDTLEKYSNLEQDHILVWLIRLQYVLNEFEELHKSYKKSDTSNQSDHHRQLIRAGLEMQLREYQSKIPSHLSTTPSILMASLTSDAFIAAAPLMQTVRPRSDNATSLMVDTARLQGVTYTTRAFFEYVSNLSHAEISRFCGADITRFIITIILAFRLSFPMPFCPGYDYAQGRRVLEFGKYLTKLSTFDEDTEGGVGEDGAQKKIGKKADVVTALKVVLGSVKTSFDRRSAVLEAAAEENNRRARLCPMFDGSLEEYLPMWEGEQHPNNTISSSYATSSHSANSSVPVPVNPTVPSVVEGVPVADASKPMLFHDLWATMTMGWAADMDENMQQQAGIGVVGDVEEYVDLMGMRGGGHINDV
ncbi:hypothetical protein F5Y04DRAFT_260331 [Hypomontagnella monticulosa]|nr:hypothetical protein F5Y04DRAFT_260331 [Hypomontagnella monticulosa]